MGEGVLTELLCIVYEMFFLKAPKTLYFAIDFLMAGTADANQGVSGDLSLRSFIGFIRQVRWLPYFGTNHRFYLVKRTRACC